MLPSDLTPKSRLVGLSEIIDLFNTPDLDLKQITSDMVVTLYDESHNTLYENCSLEAFSGFYDSKDGEHTPEFFVNDLPSNINPYLHSLLTKGWRIVKARSLWSHVINLTPAEYLAMKGEKE